MKNIKELMEEKITGFYNKGNIQADDIADLFKEIDENFDDDKDTKMKFYNQFIQKTKEFYLEQIKNIPRENVEETISIVISSVRGHLENTSLSSEEIDEIFTKNGFEIETFVSKEEIIEEETIEEEEEEIITKEIDIINSRINELENNNDVKQAIEDENNKSIEELETELKEIEKLRDENHAILQKVSSTEEEKKEATTKIVEYVKQAKELKNIINHKKDLHQKYGNKSLEELEVELKNIENLRDENHAILEKKDVTEEEKKDAEEKQEKYTKQVIELSTIIKFEKIKHLKQKYDNKSLEELEIELKSTEKLRDENHAILGKTSSTKEEKEEAIRKIEECRKQIKDLSFFIEFKKKNVKLVELIQLKTIRDAYNQIINEAKEKINIFDEENIDLDKIISEYVDEHELMQVLNGYDGDLEKLKQELKQDVKEKLTAKKIDKKEKNNKLLLKGLAALAGFGAGLALSSVQGPIFTPMLATASTAKLVISAANCWADKHPEGKIASIRNNLDSWLDKKCPKVKSGIEKMRQKLKSTPLNYFVNGVSAGYLAGNLIELATGKTLGTHLKSTFDNSGNVVNNTTSQITYNHNYDHKAEIFKEKAKWNLAANTNDNIVDTLAEVPFKKNDVVDLSEIISRGCVNSDPNTKSVSLIKEVLKNAVYDKAVINEAGEVVYHFNQLNDQGLAWIKASQIPKSVIKTLIKTL